MGNFFINDEAIASVIKSNIKSLSAYVGIHISQAARELDPSGLKDKDTFTMTLEIKFTGAEIRALIKSIEDEANLDKSIRVKFY